jgi:hypothetical protein
MQSPDTAEIDRIHSVKLLTSGISSFNGETLHTGIVERRVQPPKCRNGLLDHRLHLSFIRDIAANSNRLMAGGDQALGGCPHCRFIDVNERDPSTLRSKCLSRSQAHTGAGPGDECNLVLKGQIHKMNPLSCVQLERKTCLSISDCSFARYVRGTERHAP